MKKVFINIFIAVLVMGCVMNPSLMSQNTIVEVEAASIKLNATNITLKNVRAYQLKVKNTKKKVTWKSSKPSVASVSSKGKVTAKKAGTATITAKVAGKKLKCKVTVKNPSVKLNATSKTLAVNKTTTLKVTGTTKKATWKSSNSGVATVTSKGKVTAKKVGTATITAKVSGKTLKCKITVKKVLDSTYVRVQDHIPTILVDLRYATKDNFTKKVIYNFKDAYLRYGTVKKLKKVQNELLKKGYSLKIWDAYRPYSAQKKLWKAVPDSRYVANPKKGPTVHSYGATVDITIVKKDGTVIPLPTEFDTFNKKADRDYSDIKDPQAVSNVKLLEKTMYKYGFTGFKNEWWHYTDKEKSKYKYVDFVPKS